MDWTEKHRPRSLKDVVGNGPGVGRLKAWADAWATGRPPERRAVVLAGPPGTGKTSTALALAADMGWTPIELNASDSRNAGTIRKVATAGALHHTFAADGSFGSGGPGGRKLIILDEADNLYERAGEGGLDDSGSDLSDKGGKAQIVETIRTTQQPIVLIVNDLYALQKGSGSSLRSLCEEIKFQRVNVRSIPAALGRIAAAEGVTVDREVLEAIAVKAEGDLRAAVRDFESIAIGRTHVGLKDLGSLGQRDTTGSMFDLVRHVLKGRKLDDVRKEVWSVDATPDDLALWVDENMPKEYRDPQDLVRGYEMLARADQFLGRTRRTQNYGLWSYAGELATLGVMTARRVEYQSSGYQPFGFPQWLSKMGRTKGMRQAKDELALVLGRATHTSKRKSRLETVEAFTVLFQTDREFAIEQSFLLELDDEQVALLLGDQATAKLVKEIRASVDARTPAFPPIPPVKTKALPDEDDEDAPTPPAKKLAPTDDDAGEEGEDEAPKRPTPKPGQKGLFGF